MYNLPDEAVPEASAAVSSPPGTSVPEIRPRAADAILGPVPLQKTDAACAQRGPQLFKRLSGYGLHAALAACLFGFAWGAGSYFSSGQSPHYAVEPRSALSVVPKDSVESAEMVHTVQKMAAEIRALQSHVEAMHAAQSLSAKDATALGNLKTHLEAVKTETSAAIGEVMDKIEHSQRESAMMLSQVSDRLDRLEHQIAALLAAQSVAKTSASGRLVARKQTQGGRGDAFDPSQNPTAPGVPRPLGSLAPAASANNPPVETAYGQRNN